MPWFARRSAILGRVSVAVLLTACSENVELATAPSPSQSTDQGELTVTQTLEVAGEEGTLSLLVVRGEDAETPVVDMVSVAPIGPPQELIQMPLPPGTYLLHLSQHFCVETGCPAPASAEARQFVEAGQGSFPCEGRFELRAGRQVAAVARIGTLQPAANDGTIKCELEVTGG